MWRRLSETESYECKSAESKSSESQWSASRSSNSILGCDDSNSVALSKLDMDSSTEEAFRVIGSKLTAAEIQSFRESFSSAKIRALRRASNAAIADKLSRRRLEDQVKSLTEEICRLKQTKEAQMMAEIENAAAKMKETQRMMEMENKTLWGKLAKNEEIRLAEKRANEKAAQEMNNELQKMRKKVLNLMMLDQTKERAAAEAAIKMHDAFAEKLIALFLIIGGVIFVERIITLMTEY